MYFRNTSTYSCNNGYSFSLGPMSFVTSVMRTTYIWHPFLKNIPSCKDEIHLISIGNGTPFIFMVLPPSSRHSILAWCCSSQFILKIALYDPMGRMLSSVTVGNTFSYIGNSLTTSLTFLFVPVARWTNQVL